MTYPHVAELDLGEVVDRAARFTDLGDRSSALQPLPPPQPPAPFRTTALLPAPTPLRSLGYTRYIDKFPQLPFRDPSRFNMLNPAPVPPLNCFSAEVNAGYPDTDLMRYNQPQFVMSDRSYNQFYTDQQFYQRQFYQSQSQFSQFSQCYPRFIAPAANFPHQAPPSMPYLSPNLVSNPSWRWPTSGSGNIPIQSYNMSRQSIRVDKMMKPLEGTTWRSHASGTSFPPFPNQNTGTFYKAIVLASRGIQTNLPSKPQKCRGTQTVGSTARSKTTGTQTACSALRTEAVQDKSQGLIFHNIPIVPLLKLHSIVQISTQLSEGSSQTSTSYVRNQTTQTAGKVEPQPQSDFLDLLKKLISHQPEDGAPPQLPPSFDPSPIDKPPSVTPLSLEELRKRMANHTLPPIKQEPLDRASCTTLQSLQTCVCSPEHATQASRFDRLFASSTSCSPTPSCDPSALKTSSDHSERESDSPEPYSDNDSCSPVKCEGLYSCCVVVNSDGETEEVCNRDWTSDNSGTEGATSSGEISSSYAPGIGKMWTLQPVSLNRSIISKKTKKWRSYMSFHRNTLRLRSYDGVPKRRSKRKRCLCCDDNPAGKRGKPIAGKPRTGETQGEFEPELVS